MRNPNRIKPFLEKIQGYWELNPDLRFGQIISILSDKIGRDIFYVEENEWLNAIQKFIDNSEKNYEYKTANYIKELADSKKVELIDIKKEIEKAIKKILSTIEMMAKKGDYQTSYFCSQQECTFIENLTFQLNELGFKTKIIEFRKNEKVISINWGSEDNGTE